MVADFSNIKAQGLKPETTKEYTFDMIEGEPSVICRPAHDDNEEFLDERLRLLAERANDDKPIVKKSGVVTPGAIKSNLTEDRDYDRRIIAAVCIKSWGVAPIDVKGKPVPFSPENALAFLEALPETSMLDPFRAWVQNIYNFVDRPKRKVPNGDSLGEASPEG